MLSGIHFGKCQAHAALTAWENSLLWHPPSGDLPCWLVHQPELITMMEEHNGQQSRKWKICHCLQQAVYEVALDRLLTPRLYCSHDNLKSSLRKRKAVWLPPF